MLSEDQIPSLGSLSGPSDAVGVDHLGRQKSLRETTKSLCGRQSLLRTDLSLTVELALCLHQLWLAGASVDGAT